MTRPLTLSERGTVVLLSVASGLIWFALVFTLYFSDLRDGVWFFGGLLLTGLWVGGFGTGYYLAVMRAKLGITK